MKEIEDKKQVIFRANPQKWERFIELCNSSGTSAAAALQKCIELCLEAYDLSLLGVNPVIATDSLDSRINRILEARLPGLVKSILDSQVDSVDSQIIEREQPLEQLEIDQELPRQGVEDKTASRENIAYMPASTYKGGGIVAEEITPSRISKKQRLTARSIDSLKEATELTRAEMARLTHIAQSTVNSRVKSKTWGDAEGFTFDYEKEVFVKVGT